jgi:hypothetical protein
MIVLPCTPARPTRHARLQPRGLPPGAYTATKRSRRQPRWKDNLSTTCPGALTDKGTARVTTARPAPSHTQPHTMHAAWSRREAGGGGSDRTPPRRRHPNAGTTVQAGRDLHGRGSLSAADGS